MSIYRKVSLSATAGIIGVFGLAGAAGAATIFEHQGDTDPATEGWSLGRAGAGQTVEPVQNDGNANLDAWKVLDGEDGDGDSQSAQYVQGLTSQESQDANTNGWVLSTRHRVVDDGGASNARIVQFSDGQTDAAWRMTFGANQAQTPGDLTDGTTTVRLNGDDGDQIFDVVGTGYHLYELEYDPTTGTASLSVDGTTLSTGTYDGISGGGGDDEVLFGSLAFPATGEVNYNSVEFEIVPEPATLGLLTAGGLFLLSSRSRRRA